MLIFNQSTLIEQAMFTYSPLGKALEKQINTFEDQRRKQIDAFTNQNERLTALTNRHDHKDNYKEIFKELVKERFDEIKELTDEINYNDSICYFKGNTAGKEFDDLNNGIELFRKIRSGDMELEEAKRLQNVFKSNRNEMSRGRNKSEEQKMALEYIRFLY